MDVNVCIERTFPDVEYAGTDAVRIALLKAKKWPKGSQIHYAFRGGSTDQRKHFQSVCEEWMKYGNLDLKPKTASVTVAEIRVSFVASEGAYSYIGTDALRQPTGQPTMNLGFGFKDGNEGTYMHELMHAVGAIHEHQNPKGGIKWNEAKVIEDLSGPPNNWDRATIQRNMFDKYSESQLNASQFDPKSIMLYAIPRSWTLDGFSSTQNKTLSPIDIQWIRQEYPGRSGGGGGPDPVAKDLDVIRLQSYRDDISKPGEQDLFRFTSQEESLYHIEALGGTPVLIRLFGPNSPTEWIYEVNNFGMKRNAQMTQRLKPGIYYVQISHAETTGVGPYSIRVLQIEEEGTLAKLTGETTIKVVCPVYPGTPYMLVPSE